MAGKSTNLFGKTNFIFPDIRGGGGGGGGNSIENWQLNLKVLEYNQFSLSSHCPGTLHTLQFRDVFYLCGEDAIENLAANITIFTIAYLVCGL